MTSDAQTFQETFPFEDTLDVQIRALLEVAVRAPSTHNSQPWKFHIEDHSVVVARDTSIQLPHSDAQGRYAHISIGFLIEHLVALATWLAMEPVVQPLFEGDLIARISLSPARPPEHEDREVAAIFSRKNRRGLFVKESLPEALLQALAGSTGTPFGSVEMSVTTNTDEVRTLAEATATNMRRVYQRSSFRAEMSRWIVPTGSHRTSGIPGYSLNQPALLSWILPLMIRFINMGNMLAKLNYGAICSAPAVVGFASEESARGWVSVGYAASRAVRMLVAQGFDYSVFVASIEYEDTRSAMQRTLALTMPFQFVFVTGKLPGTVSWRTPRAPLTKKIY